MADDPIAPKRIQRKRLKGWRMPENTVYVGRPSRFGNPFTLTGDWIVWATIGLGYKADADSRRRAVVDLYRAWVTGVAVRIRKPTVESGAIEYEDGTIIPTSEHIQGLAGFMAAASEWPVVPSTRPPIQDLRGKDLACYCRLDQLCHADVLLELANAD